MGNLINYAERWERQLLQTFIDNSYIAPFVASNVKFLDAKTFHFTTMTTSGYKTHGLGGGWNRGKITQTDHPYTLEHDRDVEFFVDKREVDESNQTASIQNISNQFTITQSTPENDSYFFSKVAATAIEKNLATQTATGAWDAGNVVKKLKAIIKEVKRYKNSGLILYVCSEIMDALSLAEDFKRTIDVAAIVEGGKSIQTRITTLDGTPLVEIIDDDRFYTAFDYTEGFAPATGAYKNNVVAATPQTTLFVPKFSSIYFFAPGQHTQGDGYLYQNRSFSDAFIFPNGKDGKIDSIFVDYDTTSV